jgi:WD40 repeat protein
MDPSTSFYHIMTSYYSRVADVRLHYSSLITRHDLHKGPVRGLDFNIHSRNLLASGATNGEVRCDISLVVCI